MKQIHFCAPMLVLVWVLPSEDSAWVLPSEDSVWADVGVTSGLVEGCCDYLRFIKLWCLVVLYSWSGVVKLFKGPTKNGFTAQELASGLIRLL